MGTGVIAVIFFIFVIMMAAIVAVMTVIYAARLPSSKAPGGTREAKKGPDAIPEPVADNKPKADKSAGVKESLPVPRKRTAWPATTRNTKAPEARVDQPDTEERRKPGSSMNSLFKRPKTERQKKQAEPEQSVLQQGGSAVAPEPKVDPTVANPAAQKTVTEHKAAEVLPIASPDTQAPKAAATAVAGGVPAVTPEPAPSKPTEPGPGAKTAPEPARASAAPAEAKPEPAKAATPEPAKASAQPPPEKSKMGDLSELFAKNTTEENDSGKLAEGMAEVDVSDLLQEGRGLIDRLKGARK